MDSISGSVSNLGSTTMTPKAYNGSAINVVNTQGVTQGPSVQASAMQKEIPTMQKMAATGMQTVSSAQMQPSTYTFEAITATGTKASAVGALQDDNSRQLETMEAAKKAEELSGLQANQTTQTFEAVKATAQNANATASVAMSGNTDGKLETMQAVQQTHLSGAQVSGTTTMQDVQTVANTTKTTAAIANNAASGLGGVDGVVQSNLTGVAVNGNAGMTSNVDPTTLSQLNSKVIR